ncbi:hypothetical protein PTKIN_Ptkin13bG0171300 [Pterospermum kingtungense]
MLENLNLSYNKLSGRIPSLFSAMKALTSTDFSYNNLEGPLPISDVFRHASPLAFSNNKGLCGEVEGMVLSLALLVLYAIFRRAKMSWQSNEATSSKSGNLFSILNYDGKIVYEDIVKATESFDEKYCIGVGGTGKVYKANLTSGPVLAIKKIGPPDGEEVEEIVFPRPPKW